MNDLTATSSLDVAVGNEAIFAIAFDLQRLLSLRNVMF